MPLKLFKTPIFIILFLLAAFSVFFLLVKDESRYSKESGKVHVVTSFYPLYFFALEVGGDKVIVKNITPTGVEPHDYEPTTDDIIEMTQSKAILLNGAGLEPWEYKISELLKGKNVAISRTAEGLAHVSGFENNATAPDPHVWLDPVLAKQQVSRVVDTFVSIDPANGEYYKQQELILSQKLDTLNSEFTSGLSQCNKRNVVTSHSALNYLADRYGFKQTSIAGLSPDEEPSPKQLGEITDFIKRNGIKYIFTEELVSPALAKTLASETNAEILQFNPLEGLTDTDIKAGKDYFSVQRQNLVNLRIALECN